MEDFAFEQEKKDQESQVSRPCPKQRDSGFSWHLISLTLKELPFLKNLKWNFEVSVGTLVIDLDVKDLIFFPLMNLAYKIKVDLEMIF